MPLDLGDNRRCADGTTSCSSADVAVTDGGADVFTRADVLEENPGVDVPVAVDALTASEDVPVRCVAPTAPTTRCGAELLGGWLARPTCGAGFGARSFLSLPANSTLASCTSAVDLAGGDSNAELPLPAVGRECRPTGPITVTMVGRLPRSYQRGLGFVLNWMSGEFITMNRWVWNSAGESATDVLVSVSGGALLAPQSRSTDAGNILAQPGRPWGSAIGNDGGWWTMSVTVDPSADIVTATFAQPSQSPTVYTATYSASLPDDSLPAVRVLTAGPCDGTGVLSELLSVTSTPSLWR